MLLLDRISACTRPGRIAAPVLLALSISLTLVPGVAAGGLGGADDAGDPTEITNVGGTIYLTADDQEHGRELWKSDGTAAGTMMVEDVHPSGSSNPTDLTAIGGSLYFSATDGTHGRELWVSDGTPAGTRMIRDIRPGAPSSLGPWDPESAGAFFVPLGGSVYFQATSGASGRELWKTDGTRAGTRRVKDINPSGGSHPQWLTRLGDELLFIAYPDSWSGGPQLWKTNGTNAGTSLVSDLPGGPGAPFGDSFGAKELVRVGGTLYFTPTACRPPECGDNGIALWRSDGTATGTRKVKDLNPGGDDSVEQLTRVGGTLVFTAIPNGGDMQLYRTDGSAGGTIRITDRDEWFQPFRPTNVGGTLFLAASDEAHGEELWKSDLTATGTRRVKDIVPGEDSAFLDHLTNVGGTLFFVARDVGEGSFGGTELWVSDGTRAGTHLVEDINADETSDPDWLTNVGGLLYFSANDGFNGRQLWVSDGTPEGTKRVADVP